MERERILQELAGLRPFWRERFCDFLSRFSDNGRIESEEEIARILEEHPALRWLAERLLEAVPDSWRSG